jgi:nitroreductase
MQESELEVRTVDTLEAIKTRRAIRKYKPEIVPDDMMETILDAGRLAPTGSNLQPWKFIVIKNPTTIDLIRKLSPGYFGAAPQAIVICSDKATAYEKGGVMGRDYLTVADCSMAAENMLLAAHVLGLGACPMKSFATAAIKEVLEIPDGIEPELILIMGYPDEKPNPPPKYPLEKIAFLDRYGQVWPRSKGGQSS